MHTHVADQEIYEVGEEAAGRESGSGVSWGAVFAGAAAAAALTLLLMILGFGLGLSAVSPWSYSISAIGASTAAWIAFTQLAASALGGYLAGRLRVKWAAVHTDEVFFRDTAHGLLSWAIASLITAAILVGAVRVAVGGALDVGTRAVGAVAPAVATAAGQSATGGAGIESALNPMDYYADLLLRSDQAAADPAGEAAMRSEVSKIFVANMRSGRLSPEDRAYLASMVAKRSGMSPADAERRVDDVFARAGKAAADAQASAKQAAETARKAASRGSLWAFVALLLGAFVASLFATFGGRQRDRELMLRSS